jgi:hypothetical protein
MGGGISMKRYGEAKSIVMDRLRSYRAAMRVISNAARQECGGATGTGTAENLHPNRDHATTVNHLVPTPRDR